MNETQIKLTKLASCAGCGAKVGAGTLAQMLDGFVTHQDPRLLVGYDKSDDASVYQLDEETALVQTTDFFRQSWTTRFYTGRSLPLMPSATYTQWAANRSWR